MTEKAEVYARLRRFLQPVDIPLQAPEAYFASILQKVLTFQMRSCILFSFISEYPTLLSR